MGISGPHLIHDSLGQSEPTIQTASQSVQLISYRWPQSVTILYNGRPFTPKLPLSMGGSGPPFNKWFIGPTRVLHPNGILISSAVFAGLTSVTDRQTDRPTDHATRSVTTDRTSFRRRGLIMSSTHHPRRSLGSRIYSRELQTGAGWRRSTRRGRLEDRWTDYCELLDTTMGRERTAAPECCASTSTAPWQCPPETCDL